jgi:hypothetical protein
MANQTSQKLEEALFFLKQLRANRGKHKKFDFFLSAFIGSARSVSWIMNKDYTHVAGWKAWYEAKENTRTEQERKLLEGTNRMRISAVKHGSLQATSSYILKLQKVDLKRFKSKPTGRISMKVSGTTKNCLVEIITEGGEHISFPSTKVMHLRREVAEFPAEDVIGVCQKYYEYLSTLVEECSQKFEAQMRN